VSSSTVRKSDIEDAKAGRRSNKFKDEVLLKSIGNLTERAFAPSRVSGGQPLKILAAARVLRRHEPDSRPVEASAFFSTYPQSPARHAGSLGARAQAGDR
jgi:hypothetical protein